MLRTPLRSPLRSSLLSAAFAGAAALAAPPSALAQPPDPADPPVLAPLRDATMSPVVLEAGEKLRARLRQLVPDEPESRARLDLPVPGALVAEDHGNIVVIRGTNGELDVNWSDPNQLQNALFSIIQAFYDTHRSANPHFLTVVTTFNVESPAAFYMPISNDVRGIGYQHAHRRQTFDAVPGLSVNGVIFMNSYRNYTGRFAQIGRFTFNQELGHRWGAFVYFRDPLTGQASDLLLGRDCAHWSFFANSENSAMEGNVWTDNGNGTFRTSTAFNFGFSQLDRYLMGFAPPEAVEDTFVISEAGQWPCQEASRGRQYNPAWYPPTPLLGQQQTVSGRRVNVSIDDIVAVEGPREPAYEDSLKRWSMVVILAARQNDTVNDATIATVDQLRVDWERYFERDATEPGYQGPDLVTTLDGSDTPPPPTGASIGERCTRLDDCAESVTHCVGVGAGSRICTNTCEENSDCPNRFCCVPSVPGEDQLRHNWYCVQRDGNSCPDFSGEGGAGGGAGGAGGGEGGAGGGEGGAGGGEGGAGGDEPEPRGEPGPEVEQEDDFSFERVGKKEEGGCSAVAPASPTPAALLLGALGLLGLRRRRR